MTKKHQVTFDSGDENYFRVHIGYNILSFQIIMKGFISVNQIIFFCKMDE